MIPDNVGRQILRQQGSSGATPQPIKSPNEVYQRNLYPAQAETRLLPAFGAAVLAQADGVEFVIRRDRPHSENAQGLIDRIVLVGRLQHHVSLVPRYCHLQATSAEIPGFKIS